MVAPILGNLSQDTAAAVVAVEEGKLEAVAFVAGEHTADMKAVVYQCMVGCCTVVAAMVALGAVAGTAVAGVGIQPEAADCDIVGLPGCLNNTRRKPSCLLTSTHSISV